MKKLILMALEKAERLDDEQLATEIARLESGHQKLRLPDERGRRVDFAPVVLAVFRRVQEERRRGNPSPLERAARFPGET